MSSVQREARVLTIVINIDHFDNNVVVKGVWTEEETWREVILNKGEIVKGISFQNDKIVVWYEWEEGPSKDEVVRRALNWARDVVGKMFDEAEVLEVGE